MKMICTTCGAQMASGARYCRRCGAASGAVPEMRSVLDAETRTLGKDPHITGQFKASSTGEAYLSPQQSAAGNISSAHALAPKHTKRNILIGAVGAILILVPLVLLLGFLVLKTRLIANAPRIPVPALPRVIAIPPIPAPPEIAAPAADGSTDDTSLIYPGAETLVQTARGGGTGVTELLSHDSFDKVFDWYVAKLKPSKVVKSPPNNAVLKANNALAIITTSGSDTQILIKRGADDEVDVEDY